jgi:hypothetical protein
VILTSSVEILCLEANICGVGRRYSPTLSEDHIDYLIQVYD